MLFPYGLSLHKEFLLEKVSWNVKAGLGGDLMKYSLNFLTVHKGMSVQDCIETFGKS